MLCLAWTCPVQFKLGQVHVISAHLHKLELILSRVHHHHKFWLSSLQTLADSLHYIDTRPGYLGYCQTGQLFHFQGFQEENRLLLQCKNIGMIKVVTFIVRINITVGMLIWIFPVRNPSI